MMYLKNKFFLFFLLFFSQLYLFIVPDHGLSKKQNKHELPAVSSRRKKSALVTVFVHGTLLPFPSWAGIKHVFSHQRPPGCSGYQHYINALRLKSVVRYQPIGMHGLLAISEKNKELVSPAAYRTRDIFSALYARHLDNVYDDYFFYTFGWSGRLSHTHRKKAARNLYRTLLFVKEKLKIKGYSEIAFDLYGHSHGGNVILNLAAVSERAKKKRETDLIKKNKQKSNHQEPLLITHAVLLGTPIQKETARYFNAPCFSSIYNFYSRGDAIQIADLFSSKKPKSCRRFDHFASHETLRESLKQIECSVGKLKPRHIELWFYKSSSNFLYRDYLITNPCPLLVHMPVIISFLDKKNYMGNNIYWHTTGMGKNFVYTLNPHEKGPREETVVIPKSIFLFGKNIDEA